MAAQAADQIHRVEVRGGLQGGDGLGVVRIDLGAFEDLLGGGYGSQINRMNSVNVGPKKDILALWKAAADKYGMPFGLSEHLGASFSWWRVNKGCDKTGPYAGVPYDGNDPAWQDFYHANQEHGTGEELDPWYTGTKSSARASG